EDEAVLRRDNSQQPRPTWRKCDWKGSPDPAGFRQDAHESNHVRARRLSSKRILRLQADKIAAVAEHDFRFEWQLPEQCSTELGSPSDGSWAMRSVKGSVYRAIRNGPASTGSNPTSRIS